MRRALALSLLAGGASLLACASPHLVPEEERLRVTRELSGRPRWLRVSVYVGPFYADAASALVTDQPPAELELLEMPGGATINAPAADRILPPGTPVLLREVEFPTAGAMARRYWTTPRYHPWARLEIPSERRPAVLVLPQEVRNFEDVRAALDRVLADRDTAPDLAALPEAHRKAVARKELVEGMGPKAVAMAWGYPERMIVDRPGGKEQWIWAGGRRRAWLEDERLLRFEGGAAR